MAVPFASGEVHDEPSVVVTCPPAEGGREGKVGVQPRVKRYPGTGNVIETIQITGAPADVEAISAKISERAATEGKIVYDVATTDGVLTGDHTVTPGLLPSRNPYRPLLKIAYEIGAILFRDAYLNDIGVSLARSVMHNEDYPSALMGYFAKPSAFAKWVIPDYYHVVAVAAVADGWRCFIRLFSVVEASVLLVPKSRAPSPGNVQPFWLLMDPVQRIARGAFGDQPPRLDPLPGVSVSWEQTDFGFCVRTTYGGVETTKTHVYSEVKR